MPQGDPIGRDFPAKMPGARNRPRATVIGVVRDIKYGGLESAAGPSVYVPWSDMPAGHVYLAARTTGNTLALASAVRAVVRDVAPRLPAMPFRTLDDIVERSVADRRLRALLGGSVALLAFAVAMVGLAASLMRVVSERRQELAIRAALGASPRRAIASIMREGAVLAAAGVAIGIGGALALGRALGALIHGVSPHDPATLAGVAALVAAASLAACYLPARRAARVDPLVLLRAD
jgi:putative ABC transport system permease protein